MIGISLQMVYNLLAEVIKHIALDGATSGSFQVEGRK